MKKKFEKLSDDDFNEKSQAAMEFLMTYGWAILAAVIAIGVLAYFGVFTPGKYVSGTAVVTPPFYVNAWKVNTTTVTLELKNNGGMNYNITSVAVVGCITNTDIGIIQSGNVSIINLACSNSGLTNFKGDITIRYTKEDSSVELTSSGTISEKVTNS